MSSQEELKDHGHTAVGSDWAAVVQVVLIDPDTMPFTCDLQQNDALVGFLGPEHHLDREPINTYI